MHENVLSLYHIGKHIMLAFSIIDEIDSSLGYGGGCKGYHFFFVINNWSGDIL